MLKEKRERILVKTANFLLTLAVLIIAPAMCCTALIGEPKLPDKFLKNDE